MAPSLGTLPLCSSYSKNSGDPKPLLLNRVPRIRRASLSLTGWVGEHLLYPPVFSPSVEHLVVEDMSYLWKCMSFDESIYTTKKLRSGDG